MATVNSLGPHDLRNWIGTIPPVVQTTSEVLSYPGVDYEAVRVHEIRSGQFVMDSVVDVPTILDARATAQDYADLIGEVPQELVWNGYSFDDEDLRVLVLQVQLLSIRRRGSICGALSPGNTIDLNVRWSLIFTPYTGP